MTLEDSIDEFNIKDNRSLNLSEKQKEKEKPKNVFGGTNAGIEL